MNGLDREMLNIDLSKFKQVNLIILFLPTTGFLLESLNGSESPN